MVIKLNILTCLAIFKEPPGRTPGQRVYADQVLAWSGSSSFYKDGSQAPMKPHLHFMVFHNDGVNDDITDPFGWDWAADSLAYQDPLQCSNGEVRP